MGPEIGGADDGRIEGTGGVRPSAAPTGDATGAALRARYRAYRRRQGAELLTVVPRDAIRSLYRAALDRAVSKGEPVGDDMMGMLADFCSEILPLPPFDVWKADYLAHRYAHLDEAESRGPVPPPLPVTVDVRSFTDPVGGTWYASLDVGRAGGAWRGSLAFHQPGDGSTFRTGEIFREPDAAAVRSRFLEFDVRTLRAFLRSVLP